MASSPAAAMAGPVPAPVEASGLAPAALPSSAVFGETVGLVAAGVLPPALPALRPIARSGTGLRFSGLSLVLFADTGSSKDYGSVKPALTWAPCPIL